MIVTFSGLFAGIFLMLAGHGMLGTLITLRLGLAGNAVWVIGPVSAAYFGGLVIGTFYAHRLIGRIGHIRAFAFFASLMSAAALAHPFAIEPLPWAALRLLAGVCMAGVFMCLESWLNDRAGAEMRGRVLSLYMVFIYLGQGTGQFLLALPDTTGWALFVIASALISMAVISVASTRLQAPELPRPHRMPIRDLYRLSPVGVVGALISGLSLGAFYGLAPVFVQAQGMDFAGISAFMGLAIIGGLCMQWPIGWISDKVDRRTVLAVLAAVLGLVSLAGPWAASIGPLGLLLLAPVFGGLISTLYPIAVAHTNDRMQSADLVAASGGLITIYGVGAVAGPLVASAVMEATGANGLWVHFAVSGAVLAGFIGWRMTRRVGVDALQQGPYQVLPRTTPLAGTLDPRGPGASQPDTAADTEMAK